MNPNNSNMNPNNDDNVKVNVNCCYNDTNNILSFYLWLQQVQVRSLDDDHDSYGLDHNTIRCGNNNVHIKNDDDVMYDNNDITYNNKFEYSISIGNNDVLTDFYEADTVCDGYNDHNNNINIITCDYDNYDKDNNNHVDCYDVGIAQEFDLVANDCKENNYATSLVSCAPVSYTHLTLPTRNCV